MLLRILIILFVCISFLPRAEQRLIVGADQWDGYTNIDGTGIYFELLKQIYPDYKLEFKLNSYNRTIVAFEKGEIDITLGIPKEDVQQAIFPLWFIDTEYPVLAFYEKQFTKIEHASDFQNLSISWQQGYHFDRY